MAQGPSPDVFTAAELALAARVPTHAVEALIESGELAPVKGTRFIRLEDAVRAGRCLRAVAAEQAAAIDMAPPPLFSAGPGTTSFAHRRNGLQAAASSFIHVAVLVTVGMLTTGYSETAFEPVAAEEARLVFVMSPGPGGGGGGGGMRSPLPAPRLERRGVRRSRVAVPPAKPERVMTTKRAEEPPRPTPPPAPEPKPVERAPEPLPSRVLVAPVATVAANERDVAGTIEKPLGTTESQGRGDAGGAGTGRGTGNGEGLGSGIGDGTGGGFGGGPFRPGSGIDPPRLIREVKAEYTDEARRRNLTGDVLLEIVVKHDGSVGEVTVLQGLGAGLDQRAVNAVRQWRFAPARRKGEPVDVLVEVAVEFTLR